MPFRTHVDFEFKLIYLINLSFFMYLVVFDENHYGEIRFGQTNLVQKLWILCYILYNTVFIMCTTNYRYYSFTKYVFSKKHLFSLSPTCGYSQ